MEVLDTTAIQALLPHRYPFLLVDRIDVVEAGKRVTGYKRVTGGEWWNDGASMAGDATPAMPAMPHSLILEALAQTSGALVRDLLDGADNARAYFMAAHRVRIRRPAAAGDLLTFDLSLVSWRRGICRARGVASVDGQTVLSAELTTVVRAA
jgi:3-hydroxymyristoyl/3-hydroxydecanoyl-(acyl carrier protein) dehydratase